MTTVTRSAVHAISSGIGVAVAFQPIVSLRDDEIEGVEALARFPGAHPAPPQDWFAKADAIGCGLRLQLATVRRAIELWRANPIGHYVAVNVSSRALVDPQLLTAVLEADVPYGSVVVEVTEQRPVQDDDETRAAIERLRAAGTRIALDDVGTGFASLDLVARLRPDIVKVDRSLLRRLRDSVSDDATAAAATALAHAYGGCVAIEGVESIEDLRRCRALGADAAQGHYLGRPSTQPAIWRAWAGGRRSAAALI
jgi:EAL domain-containing protein (putative c-di-GMP-specific phosphodiesterase class I)